MKILSFIIWSCSVLSLCSGCVHADTPSFKPTETVKFYSDARDISEIQNKLTSLKPEDKPSQTLVAATLDYIRELQKSEQPSQSIFYDYISAIKQWGKSYPDDEDVSTLLPSMIGSVAHVMESFHLDARPVIAEMVKQSRSLIVHFPNNQRSYLSLGFSLGMSKIHDQKEKIEVYASCLEHVPNAPICNEAFMLELSQLQRPRCEPSNIKTGFGVKIAREKSFSGARRITVSRRTFFIDENSVLTANDIQSLLLSKDTEGHETVIFSLTPTASERIAQLTEDLAKHGDFVAIMIDKTALMTLKLGGRVRETFVLNRKLTDFCDKIDIPEIPDRFSKLASKAEMQQ